MMHFGRLLLAELSYTNIAELFIVNSPMEFAQTIPFTTRGFLESLIPLLTLEINYSLVE